MWPTDRPYYPRVKPLLAKLLQDSRKELRDTIKEGQLVAKMALQAVMDTSDIVVRSVVTTVMMCKAPCLQASGIPKEV